jgi:cytochrome P450
MQPLFNPYSPAFIRDPYAAYRILRERYPFFPSPLGFIVISRDCDVRAILSDKRFGRDFQGRITQGAEGPLFREPVIRSVGRWMLVLDPPDHTRLRGLVAKSFTPRRVQDLRLRIERIVDKALDHLAKGSRTDLIADYAARIPERVICELLGIPEEDRTAFLANTTTLVRLLDPVPLSRGEMDHANLQNLALSRYFNRLFDLRRAEPSDDLTTQLVQAQEEGDRLSQEELTANMILLFTAGYDTTANLIGNALLALLRHPAQLARLRGDDSLIGNAVEEALRYDPSVQLTVRAALEDVKLGQVVFPKGSVALLLLASANRDPQAYDEPDRFDIGRANIRLLSFGGGIHHCLGNQLARLEAEIAIGGLIRRFPNLQADDVANPDWRASIVLRGLKSLPASL